MTRNPHPRRRSFVPVLEGLEERSIPSILAAGRQLLASVRHTAAATQSISGVIENGATGQPMANVQVQLINVNGQVAQKTTSDAAGHYHFNVGHATPYVVHALTPHGMVQKTPTFPNVEATGALVPGASGASWSYHSLNTNPANGPVGPKAWATIAPEGNSPFESPINITVPPTNIGKFLKINYQSIVPLQVINNGAQIQVQFPASPADSVTVGDPATGNTPVTGYLTQFHYHDPSETTVNGHRYALEEHFVNLSPQGGETVVAVFFQLGAHNAALDAILTPAAQNLAASGTKTTITGAINFAGLLPKDTSTGWYYQGSLTTPPLSRPVNWFVLAQPITLDAGQLAEYEFVASSGGFLPNARPIQQSDGRLVNNIDYDVNYQGKSVSNQNFVYIPAATKAGHVQRT